MSNVVQGHQGADKLAGGEGGDTFLWNKSDVVNGRFTYVDVITDFCAGDRLDLRALPDISATVAVAGLVKIREANGDAIVSAAFGAASSLVDVAVLDNVFGLSVAKLHADGLLLA